MKRFCIVLILACMPSSYSVFADDVLNGKLERSYHRFVQKLERTNPSETISLLYKLSDRVDVILASKQLSIQKKELIEYLGEINNNTILQSIFTKQSKNFQDIYDSYPNISLFDVRIYNDLDVSLENGIWYYYRYNKWESFSSNTFRIHDLRSNKLLDADILLDIRGEKIVFIREFEKVKLIDDDIISGVKNKYEFLKEISDDKRFLSTDTDEYFRQLKLDTQELIGDEKDTQKKIQRIYDFVLGHVSYSQDLDIEDKKIFSGILSYKNRDGVCEGYSKLMIYMLGFAGIGDYEVIRGYVINAPDFPQIGHAWVRIGDRYYDPTFDDPIGTKQTRSPDQYFYYHLPRDLFYANRYHYEDLPEYLRDATQEYKTDFIESRLSDLVGKYDPNTYLVLKPFAFKKSLRLSYDTHITIQHLKKFMDIYKIQGKKITKNNSLVSLKKGFSYYLVTSDNLSTILKQIDYDIDNYFIVEFENGDYAIGYDIG